MVSRSMRCSAGEIQIPKLKLNTGLRSNVLYPVVDGCVRLELEERSVASKKRGNGWTS